MSFFVVLNNNLLKKRVKMQNQRKNNRLDCIVPVDGQSGSLFDHTKAIDISKGGLGFISLNAIPINEEIFIELDLSEDEEPVLVKAKVKWVEPIKNSDKYRIGMAFEDVLSGSKSRLNQYLKTKE